MNDILPYKGGLLELKPDSTHIFHNVRPVHIDGDLLMRDNATGVLTPVDILQLTVRTVDDVVQAIQTAPEETRIRAYLADAGLSTAEVVPPPADGLESRLVNRGDVPADLGEPGGAEYRHNAATGVFTVATPPA